MQGLRPSPIIQRTGMVLFLGLLLPIIRQRTNILVAANEQYRKRVWTLVLPANSIVFSKRAPIGLVIMNANPLCTNQGCMGCVPKKDTISKYYYFAMSVFTEQFELYGAGTTFKEISASNLGNFILPAPPLSDQQFIADYLDEKCGEIDSLIRLQEQMIEKLKVYKQSVITEAVTKGLDPNAKLVPSGTGWIEEIPEEWEVAPLKSILFRRSEKNNPVKTKERLSLSIDKGVTLYAEKTTNLDRFKEDFTQYQLAYPNDIVLNSMNMIVGAVGLSHFYGCVSPVYYVVYSKSKDTDIRYYSYLLNTQIIRDVYHSLGQGIYAIERGEGRVNTCRLKVSYDDFGVIRIPIPPVSEQHAIVSYLDVKCSEIDKLIAVKQQKVEKLKEYKKSVIYEAVTGKTSFAVS